MSDANAVIALISGIFGILGILWQVANLHSKVELNLNRLSNEINSVRQVIDSKLDFEKYRIANLEAKLNELSVHIEDIENFIKSHHGYTTRKYSNQYDKDEYD
jgi:hypothetical protein